MGAQSWLTVPGSPGDLQIEREDRRGVSESAGEKAIGFEGLYKTLFKERDCYTVN